ncbi:MAG: acyl-CoA dehydrogenase C-terminal domain-containing protein, partial [Pseudomonadota bacterium]
GYVTGGHYLLRGAISALGLKDHEGAHTEFLDSKIHIACFYADNLLPRAAGFAPAVRVGAGSVAALEPEVLAG